MTNTITNLDPYHEYTEPLESTEEPEQYILPYGTDQNAAKRGKIDTSLLISSAGKTHIGYENSPPPIIPATTRINGLYVYNGALTTNVQSLGQLVGWSYVNLIDMSIPTANSNVVKTSRLMGFSVQNLDGSNQIAVFISSQRVARVLPGATFHVAGLDILFLNIGFAAVSGSISDCDIRAYCMAGDK